MEQQRHILQCRAHIKAHRKREPGVRHAEPEHDRLARPPL
jgi:hypothetical protein